MKVPRDHFQTLGTYDSGICEQRLDSKQMNDTGRKGKAGLLPFD